MQKIKDKIKQNRDNIITAAFWLAPGIYWLYVVMRYGTV